MTNKTPNKTKTPVGGLILGSDPIEFNAGRKTITLKVRNTGDRPIQVGSHFHFFEVNRALEFDRHAAYGMRLNISSTTAIRFEPGDEKTVVDVVRFLLASGERAREKILALREQNVVNFGDAGMPIAKALIAEVERLKTQSTRKAQTKKEP